MHNFIFWLSLFTTNRTLEIRSVNSRNEFSGLDTEKLKRMSLCWCRRWRLFRISSISRPFFVLTADALSIDRYFITARIQNRQHSTKRSFPNIQNIDAANKLVSTLNDSERLLLRQGLLDFDQGQGSTATRSAVVATATGIYLQLFTYCNKFDKLLL